MTMLSATSVDNIVHRYRSAIDDFMLIRCDKQGLITEANAFAREIFEIDLTDGYYLQDLMTNIHLEAIEAMPSAHLKGVLTHITLENAPTMEMYVDLTVKDDTIVCLGRFNMASTLMHYRQLNQFTADLVYSNRESVKQTYYDMEQLARRHLTILNSAGESIFGMDKAGRLTFVNPYAAKMAGCDADELIGQDAHQLWHPYTEQGQPFDEQDCPIHAVLNDGKARHGQSRFMKADNTFYDVEFTTSPIIEKQAVVGAVVIFRDITQLVQHEKKIALESMRTEQLLLMKKQAELLKQAEFILQSQHILGRLTQSRASFIYQLNDTEDGFDLLTPLPTYHAQFNIADFKHLSLGSKAVLSETFICEQVKLINDFPRYMSERHYFNTLDCFNRLVISPVMEKGRLVMLVIVADKPGAYTDDDVISLKMISSELWHYLQRAKEQQQLEQASQVFNSTLEGIVFTNLNGEIVNVNSAFSQITGYAPEDVIGQNPSVLSSGRHDAGFYRGMWQALKTQGYWKGEIWNRRKSGEVYPELLTITTYTNDEKVPIGYIAVFADISQIKDSEQKLEFLSHHDPLTELPNRVLFHTYLEQAINQAKKTQKLVCTIVVNIDDFKSVNETLGFEHGDQLLLQLSKKLLASVEVGDVVARIGADEFNILVTDLNTFDDIHAYVDKLQGIFNLPFMIDSTEVFMSASIGLSFYPVDADRSDTLLQHAHTAMHRAKERSANQFEFYSHQLTESVSERFFLENDLQKALANEELFLLYQPQIDKSVGQITGMEVLLRWEHPVKGLISPVHFIPLAEKNGTIISIGEWILHRACTQAKAWLDQGFDFERIAVNITAIQIQQPDFSDMVMDILEDTGLPANKLELEITEGLIMDHSESVLRHLHVLRAQGVEIAVDDFGTGFSSLSYLKNLPIDKLKIDQSFVREIPDNEKDMAIVETITALSQVLKMKVIAEGVETDEQLTFLLDKGCHLIQGYLYSKPVYAEKIPLFFKQQF